MVGAPTTDSVAQRPNLTVTDVTDATCEQGGGDCSRASPLPTASRSSPFSWAISIAVLTLLPRNDGTRIPPCSTSNTTVPLDGKGFGSDTLELVASPSAVVV